MRNATGKRLRLASILVCIVLVLGYLLRGQQPRFEGKSLSYWLDQLPGTFVSADGSTINAWRHSYRTQAEADADRSRHDELTRSGYAAVMKIGPQCLPFLVSELQVKDPRLKTSIVQWLNRKGCLNTPRWLNHAGVRRAYSVTALIQLGPKAQETIPDLVELSSHTNAEIRASARHVLSELSPDEFGKLSVSEEFSQK